jgi:hypothetical protein
LIHDYWRLAKRVLGYAVIFVILFYITRAILYGSKELVKYNFSFNAVYLIISLFLFVAAHSLLVKSWGLLLKQQVLPHHISFFAAFRIWFLSYMGRYIPGKIALIVMRAQMSKKYDIPASVISQVAVAEVCLFFIATIFLAAPIIVISHPQFLFPALLIFLVCIFGLFCLQSNKMFQVSQKILPSDKRILPLSVPWSCMVLVILLYIGFWILVGLSLIAFMCSFLNVQLASTPRIVASYALSYCGGLIAVFAPSGLGVREILFAEQIQDLFGVELAYAISVATRLWSTLFECIIASLVWALYRIRLSVDRRNILGSKNIVT